jgi:hypothetical protein
VKPINADKRWRISDITYKVCFLYVHVSVSLVVILREGSYKGYITKTFRSDANTVGLHLSAFIGTAKHPDIQKIRIVGFLFENRLHCQSEVAETNPTNGYFSLHIYLSNREE